MRPNASRRGRTRSPFAAAIALALGLLAGPAAETFAANSIRIVTTTEDLAAIAREVGGERVSVEALCRGYQDPHFVDAKPSFMVQLKKADLFVAVGRDLEIGWAPGLLNGARNPDILPGRPGYVDASTNIEVLELPASVSRSQGDVHPLGNPHVWLDPANGAVIAATLRDALIRVSPSDAAAFRSRYEAFAKRLDAAVTRWKARAVELGFAGAKVVTYHRTWSYFAKAFDLEVVDYVEPRPGIPPSPNHVRDLTERMKQGDVRLLLMEPFFDTRLPEKIARSSGVPLVVIPTSVGAEDEIKTYFDLFDRQLEAIGHALRAKR